MPSIPTLLAIRSNNRSATDQSYGSALPSTFAVPLAQQRSLIGLILILLGFALSNASAYAQGPMVDRLLIEINRTAFTQRQFMSYYAVKVGFETTKAPFAILNQNNWQQAVNHYIDEMIINIESLRVTSLAPNQKNADLVKESLELRTKSDPEFAEFLSQLHLSTQELEGVIDTYMRIRRYIAGRQGNKQVDARKLDQLEKLRWFVNLKQRTPYRLFSGAAIFEPLQTKSVF